MIQRTILVLSHNILQTIHRLRLWNSTRNCMNLRGFNLHRVFRLCEQSPVHPWSFVVYGQEIRITSWTNQYNLDLPPPHPAKWITLYAAALAVWWPWRKLWTLRVHAHSRMCFWGVHWRPLDVSQLGKPPLQHAAFANTKLVPGSLECCGIRDGMGPHGRQTTPQQAWCIWCRGVRGGNRYWENHITPVLV